jgi:hypothetical protein
MKNILTAILVRLQEKCEGLKYIDLDWGQCDFYERDMPVKFPAALVDMRSFTTMDEGNLSQRCVGDIQVRIFALPLSPTNARAKDTQRETAAQVFDLHSDIFAALHGWAEGEQDTWSALSRTSYNKVKRKDTLREYVMTFRVAYVDNAAVPVYTPTAPPTITIIPVSFDI